MAIATKAHCNPVISILKLIRTGQRTLLLMRRTVEPQCAINKRIGDCKGESPPSRRGLRTAQRSPE